MGSITTKDRPRIRFFNKESPLTTYRWTGDWHSLELTPSIEFANRAVRERRFLGEGIRLVPHQAIQLLYSAPSEFVPTVHCVFVHPQAFRKTPPVL